MIFSKNWLGQYVRVPDDIAELTNRLTMSGLNLEEFHDVTDELSVPDVAIDLEVTSNRADCLGHLGIAREVAVLFGEDVRIPAPEPAEGGESAGRVTSVTIESPELCPEYHARVIRGVKIGPSPVWLADRLRAIGLKPVNNVVDVTNFVMMECGQPLHAFDFDKLDGRRIVVRRGVAGETITAIDQRDYAITPEMCVIADASRPVAIAGVMGGYDSEISPGTVNVLIESAAFAPMSVRATARALKLHSPSSYRFERKVDQSQLDWASRRCGELILQVAGGSLLKGSVVAGRAPAVKVRPVILRHAAVRKLLGVEIPREAGHQILLRLGLIAVQQDESRTSYVVPSWRPDLQRECDLIEEIARVYGYQHLPSDSALPVIATAKTRRELVTDLLRRELTACGLCEALTLSFVSEAQLRQFCPSGLQPALGVSHSSRSHESQLRQSLIPSLLTCRRQNERNGTPNAELFEIARVYLSAGGNDPEEVSEPLTIGLVCGRGFLQVRGIVERLVSTLAPSAVLDVEPAESSEFAAGRGAKVLLNGQPLGWLGELHARLRSELDLHDDVTVVELRLPLLEQLFEPTRRYVPLPRFPAVTRDLNFVLPESVSWKQLESVVRTAGGGLLSGVAFGGQYRGRQIDAGHKSYVVGCRFQAADRTLTAEEVDAAISSVIDQCTRELAARLRG